MLTENAIVLKVVGNRLWLEPRRRDQCGGCSVKKGCGHSLLDSLLSRSRDVPLVATLNQCEQGVQFSPGDLVSFGIEEGQLLKLAALLYGLPLLAFLAGVLLPAAFGGSELASLACGLFGLTGGVMYARHLAGSLERNGFRVLASSEHARTSHSLIIARSGADG